MGVGTMTYQELYAMVSKALYRTHVEGKLKSEIIQVGGGIAGGTRVEGKLTSEIVQDEGVIL